ncbi:hypothetical protein AMECASPLE_026687 [Ameca splendens]|uniref:Uncharacterized protein n=1 Tax=Ameca splendens TaxID=208324 RepID=A0ABV0ZQS9_9TELE
MKLEESEDGLVKLQPAICIKWCTWKQHCCIEDQLAIGPQLQNETLEYVRYILQLRAVYEQIMISVYGIKMCHLCV